MNKNFPQIMDYNYTSNIEKDLDLIADGKKNGILMLLINIIKYL